MRVFWDNPEKIVLVREFSKDWTWDDFRLSIYQMRQMLQEVEHEVYIIIDCRQVQCLPTGAIHYFNAANRDMPAHVAMRILVSENNMVQGVFSVLHKLAPKDFRKFYFAKNIQDAYKRIAQTQFA
jgi:hypothetical protein